MFSSILLSVLVTVASAVFVSQKLGNNVLRLTFLVLGTSVIFLIVSSMVMPSTKVTEESIVSLVFGIPLSIVFSLLGHVTLQKLNRGESK